MAILEAVFANKAGQTPQEVERRRRMAQALVEAGAGGKPPSSGLELAGRLAMTLTGQYQAGKAERQDATNRASASTLLANTLLGTPTTPGATGSAMPKVDAGGNIPVATAPDDVKNLIMANVPPEMQGYATNLIGKESSFNPNAVSPTGATGLAQFTRGTGKQYGLVSDQGDMRKDPVANLKALVALTNDNRTGLANALGRPPTDGELALAHQQGLQGAINLLSGKSVPGNNLAVNNVDPNMDPRAAANKIMAYYGGSGGQQGAPGEVASLDPSIGIPMPGAAGQMRANSPTQPMPQPQPQMASAQQAPALPPATNVSTPPVPSNAQQPNSMTALIPPEFQGSQQLMNADPNKGIMQALLGGTPASPEQLARAQQIGNQPQAPAGQDQRSKIAALLQNPYTQEAGQQLLMQEYERQQQAQNLILKQQLEQNDPKYRQDLEKGSIELENLRNPRLGPADEANIDLNRDKFKFEQENSQLTPDIKEYNFYAQAEKDAGRAPLSPLDWDIARRKSAASSTNVNVGEGDKFYENLDKKNAETFATLSDGGIQARTKLGMIDRLEGLMANAPQGGIGALKQAAGEWGVPTEGLSDIQAASALLEKMVPEQRQPGSGPMSDMDIKMFRASLPRIINQPGGNQLIFQTLRGITQYEMQMGEIADRVANREVSPAEGRRQIQELKNPLADFKPSDEPTPNEGWQELAPGVRVRKVK